MSAMPVLYRVALLMACSAWLDQSMGDAGAVAGVRLLAGFALSYLGFLWYRGDSDARGFARPRWLSVGMAGFTPGAIPWYLLLSRKDGERGQALMGYAACLAVVALAVWVGVAAHIALM